MDGEKNEMKQRKLEEGWVKAFCFSIFYMAQNFDEWHIFMLVLDKASVQYIFEANLYIIKTYCENKVEWGMLKIYINGSYGVFLVMQNVGKFIPNFENYHSCILKKLYICVSQLDRADIFRSTELSLSTLKLKYTKSS